MRVPEVPLMLSARPAGFTDRKFRISLLARDFGAFEVRLGFGERVSSKSSNFMEIKSSLRTGSSLFESNSTKFGVRVSSSIT